MQDRFQEIVTPEPPEIEDEANSDDDFGDYPSDLDLDFDKHPYIRDEIGRLNRDDPEGTLGVGRVRD